VRQEVKTLHEETEAIYKENQSLNKQQIALNEEVCTGIHVHQALTVRRSRSDAVLPCTSVQGDESARLIRGTMTRSP
jgi:hypothetical protein